ncbi:MAG: DUF2293 domain-containing protein [Planctomycetaceae bacterium]|nr:DUF2293 domain-containing protein [Planctomycetales bacterium]MCB9923822.1 DUF2293 domain-containing protein [Planctomycetaceae bacterium]
MSTKQRVVSPGASSRTVRTAEGEALEVPSTWELLPPGDAALTRRVKASGPCWTVQQKRGRKLFSLGVWAPRATISTIREALEAERSSEAYAKRRERELERRNAKQDEYVCTFKDAVLDYLDFHSNYSELAERMAVAVTRHATPVGSGTVARTQRIPIEKRAESAVIAWMRHQTTTYDDMDIPRVKGKRREIRQLLAEQSRRLLQRYRIGEQVASDKCPLREALETCL